MRARVARSEQHSHSGSTQARVTLPLSERIKEMDGNGNGTPPLWYLDFMVIRVETGAMPSTLAHDDFRECGSVRQDQPDECRQLWSPQWMSQRAGDVGQALERTKTSSGPSPCESDRMLFRLKFAILWKYKLTSKTMRKGGTWTLWDLKEKLWLQRNLGSSEGAIWWRTLILHLSGWSLGPLESC